MMNFPYGMEGMGMTEEVAKEDLEHEMLTVMKQEWEDEKEE